MKAQFLADFIVDLPQRKEEHEWWTLNVDGSSNKNGSGVGVNLEGPFQITLEQALWFNFETSNNQAKYVALIVGLKLAMRWESRRFGVVVILDW